MNGDLYRMPQQVAPPDGVDPGQWALESYREWRARVYEEEEGPEIPEAEDLLASMEEGSSP